ncbi:MULTISPECIES: DUF6705 family protein [Chryseobacterium]|uniref:DUF6705 domain-containing protein n=1 Tax=Chryseobacterium geocarposphaerae TaxID=1416776 RepID=A0ABU1LG52_9FLAO|nr:MULTISPECIES: DUF6705 family protein [Chryseobacterium]MDR6405712.1 hypothetical protein [Chryseobacterium geocarposphaerae]MDR6699126.1 hypothetical protein [Chryseobacterium ginsenosidimutans]
MKKIHNQFLILFLIFTTTISCKAQTIPLNTYIENIPLNAYLKDLNNELVPYIGTYQTTMDDKQITLYITKEDHKYFDLDDIKFYKDVLIVRYTVKNSSGVILQNTQNMNFNTMLEKDLIYSRRTRPDISTILFSYKGTNCGVGHGTIYLKKINDTQISWRYYAETTETYNGKCPSTADTTIYLPEGENLIFNKL